MELRLTYPAPDAGAGAGAAPCAARGRGWRAAPHSLSVDSSTLESSMTSVLVMSSRFGDKQSSSVSSYELEY